MTIFVGGCLGLALWLYLGGPPVRRLTVDDTPALTTLSKPPLSVPQWSWLRRRRVSRQRAEGTADLIELLTVVLGSGGTVLHALRVAADHGPTSTQPLLRHLQDQVRVGTPLSLALVDCADQLGSSYRATVSALLASERDGAPLSVLLVRLGDEARAARRRQAEARARRLPVQLLFPLVFCSLPAVLIGAVVPLIALSLDRL